MDYPAAFAEIADLSTHAAYLTSMGKRLLHKKAIVFFLVNLLFTYNDIRTYTIHEIQYNHPFISEFGLVY